MTSAWSLIYLIRQPFSGACAAHETDMITGVSGVRVSHCVFSHFMATMKATLSVVKVSPPAFFTLPCDLLSVSGLNGRVASSNRKELGINFIVALGSAVVWVPDSVNIRDDFCIRA